MYGSNRRLTKQERAHRKYRKEQQERRRKRKERVQQVRDRRRRGSSLSGTIRVAPSDPNAQNISRDTMVRVDPDLVRRIFGVSHLVTEASRLNNQGDYNVTAMTSPPAPQDTSPGPVAAPRERTSWTLLAWSYA